MKAENPYKRATIELILFLILVFMMLPQFSFLYDTECWRTWALDINKHGLGNIYYTPANYPPVMIYILWLYDWIQGEEKIAQNINYLKVFPLLFDLLPIVILLLLRKAADLKKGYHYFLLFNVAYLYNTLMWGQVDSIHTNLSLLAVFLCYRYPALGLSCFVLALNMKVQAIIFFPVLVLCLGTTIHSAKAFLRTVVAGLATQAILLIPFFMTHSLDRLWQMLMGLNGAAPLASVQAFNLWHLVLSTDPVHTPDTDLFIGLSYKTIGFSLFFILSAAVLFPLLLKMLITVMKKERQKSYEEISFLCGGLIALLFFFCNTEMHERYSHPAMIFLFFYGLYKRNFLLYILASVAYFLNLEKILHFYGIAYHTLIFDRQFIASIFLLTIILGIVALYRNYHLKKDLQFLKNKMQLRKSISSATA